MRNRADYKTLKQKVLTENWTMEQLEAVTLKQIATFLGKPHLSVTFLKNAKNCLIETVQNRDDLKNLQDLKATAKSWLDANFPDWEAERGREGDKPYVTIWLKGKPG